MLNLLELLATMLLGGLCWFAMLFIVQHPARADLIGAAARLARPLRMGAALRALSRKHAKAKSKVTFLYRAERNSPPRIEIRRLARQRSRDHSAPKRRQP